MSSSMVTSANQSYISGIPASFSIADFFKIDTRSVIEGSLKKIEREEQLKRNIGEVLFSKLSQSDIDFILEISGTINLGRAVDIEVIYKLLEEERNE